MTTDLTTAERELAEALCHEPDWRLRYFAKLPDYPPQERAMFHFAAQYELARREREREKTTIR